MTEEEYIERIADAVALAWWDEGKIVDHTDVAKVAYEAIKGPSLHRPLSRRGGEVSQAERILKSIFTTPDVWWMVSGQGAPGGDFFSIDGQVEITHEDRVYLAKLNGNQWCSTHPDYELVGEEEL